MRTPAGKECRFYYQDFHRGRNRQECRLIQRNPDTKAWEPSDCENCPVPDILWANASPDLHLEAKIVSGLFGLGRRVEVKASCLRHQIPIEDAIVGCPRCAEERSEGLSAFFSDEGR